MNIVESITQIAVNLNTGLSSQDRYKGLLQVIKSVIPYDIAVIFFKDKNKLIPLASHGLIATAQALEFLIDEHPRLKMVVEAKSPIKFPPDSKLPDPFDGFVQSDPSALKKVHACLAIPLIVEEEVIGVLTTDSLTPHAFDVIPDDFLKILMELAGATLRTSKLLDSLEQTAILQGMVAKDMLEQAVNRTGAELIGSGDLFDQLKSNIQISATSDLNILIQGQTGTGKEVVARQIHALSKREGKPLIYVNCAALPELIAESELFGHVRGSFTGAIADRVGKFELADKGTLFLDEIGELPLSIQAKLLRAIQEGEIQKVGSNKTKLVNVRLIAATNRDLKQEVEKGVFRKDLFHRLNAFVIHTPALADHPHDIPLMAGHFCDIYRRKIGCGRIKISESANATLKNYSWPGNVRELKNVISRASLHAAAEAKLNKSEAVLIENRHLFLSENIDPQKALKTIPHQLKNIIEFKGNSFKDKLENCKKEIILKTVEKYHGNWAQAATELGMHRSNLYTLRDKLKISYHEKV